MMDTNRTPIWAPAVLTIAAALAALGLMGAAKLELETDLVALLPKGERAVDDFRLYAETFAGLEKVYVIVRNVEQAARPADPDTLAKAAQVFADALAASPEVARSRWGIQEADREFFTHWVAPQAPLLLGGGWRGSVESRLDPTAIRIRAARIHADLLSPLGSFGAKLAVYDPFGWSEPLARHAGGGTGTSFDRVTSAFLSPERDAALVIVTPTQAEIDPGGGQRLAAAIESAEGTMRATVGKDLVAVAAGGPLYAAADESILKRDLRRTLGTSAAICAAFLVLAFEGALLPGVVLGGIPIALIWTAGLLGHLRGSLSAVAIGFAAVLVGLGIDYSIHAASRFRQEARRGRPMAETLAATYRGAAPGIVASAATTSIAFAILTLATLRPLAEVGLAVALGIVCMLAAAAAAGTAMIWYKPRERARERRMWRILGSIVASSADLGNRRRKAVLVGTALATLAAAFGILRLTIDPSLDVLRPVDHPVLAVERELVERFGLELDTTTVLVPGITLGEALERSEEVERVVRDTLGPSLQVISPRHWIVAGEERRRRLAELAHLPLARAVDEMEAALTDQGLDPRAFAPGLQVARSLERGEDPGLPSPSDRPSWLAELLHQRPEGWIAALHLRLPLSAWPDGPPPEVIAAIDRAAPGSSVASARGLGGALRRVAARDFRTLGAASVAMVVVVVALSFGGRLRPTVLALLPVTLGTVWTLGGWALAGRQLDLVSLVVMPVLLGIGIDDGLHVIHALRSDTAAGTRGALDRTGRAVALTTLTSCAGFGSLMLSSLPGLASAGQLLAIGLALCLVATVVVLPALEGQP